MSQEGRTASTSGLARAKHAFFLVLERMLTFAIIPYWRARLLAIMGAQVGKNVRVYEARFFNLQQGFRNLHIEDDVHVGPGCLLDLSEVITLKRGAVLSPRVMILTHQDPGEYHDSPLARVFPRRSEAVCVGSYAWVGASSVLLPGAVVKQLSVVGANSLVKGTVEEGTVVGGSPARILNRLTLEDGARP